VTDRLSQYWTLGVLILIVVGFSVSTPNFFSQGGWLATATAAVELLPLAAGQLFVIISKGVDLSVGSTLGLSGMVGGLVMEHTMGSGPGSQVPAILLGAVSCMVLGAVVGAVNGFGITRLKVSPLIVTLGTFSVGEGVSQLMNSGNSISNLPIPLATLGNTVFGNWIPSTVLIAAAVVTASGLLLHYTRFGKRTFAIGSNAQAALRTGIDVDRHLMRVYIFSGLLAGIAGFLVTSQLSLASVTAGANDNLSSIAAVVIGGASLFGGRGTMSGAIIGVIIITVLDTGLVIAKVSTAWQLVAVGLIIVLAVWADQQRARLTRR
jgi:ribose transport system permease protein